MKTLIAVLSICLASLSAHAQGTVNFANVGVGLNAPVFFDDGITKVSGPGYTAVLLAGPTPSVLSQVATTPLLSGAQAGYFLGGVQTLPTVAGGGTAFILVEVFQYSGVVGPPPTVFGVSSTFSVTTGNPNAIPPTVPATLIGLTSIRLNVAVPEPGTFVLTGLGATLVVLFRSGRKLFRC